MIVNQIDDMVRQAPEASVMLMGTIERRQLENALRLILGEPVVVGPEFSYRGLRVIPVNAVSFLSVGAILPPYIQDPATAGDMG